MQVILDSSVIVGGDWNLTQNSAQALLGACGRDAFELFVPRVVLSEVINSYEEREVTKLEALNKARAVIREMRGPRASEGEFAGQLKPQAGYRAHLTEVIENAGAQLVDLPDVAHRELVERSLKRQAPFDSSGKRGYRDALIWHNVLEVARSGDAIVFATADGDFREGEESDRLNKHLIRDLRERGIDPGRFTLVRTLTEVVERVLEPAKYMLDALDDQLADNPDRAEELGEAMAAIAERDGRLADCTEVEVESDIDGEPFDAEVIDKALVEVKEFERFALADAIALGEDRFGVKLWMDATAYFEVKVTAEGSSEPAEDGTAEVDPRADQSSARVSGLARARLIYELDYERSEARVGEPQLIRLSSVPDDSEKAKTGRTDGVRWIELDREEPTR